MAAAGMSRTSAPSMNSMPRSGVCSFTIRFSSVDFPEPVGPTTPSVPPFGRRKLTSFSAGALPSG